MSGIVGIVNHNGAPANRQLLQQMTAFMAYRGPDAQEIWVNGQVGFGHTMLRTTAESMCERQPFSLDGHVWITADARVDGRTDLIGKLASRINANLETATDVELILHAYHAWGQDCINHLLGDFSFAIWDTQREHLLCARDQLGIKPFYYAQVANSLIFSNTLDCVRIHPAVSGKLNDLSIGDFLLFEFNQEPTTTTFADIQRLPPAHRLTWSQGALRLNRYWSLPSNGHVRYKRASDYVEHFTELLRTAVDDRLRTDRVGVLMSGGLDSTTIAATARELLSKQFTSFDLCAYTVVYDRLIPDEERRYAGLVADALGIPIHYLTADNYMPYQGWDQCELRRPEPVHEPLLAVLVDQLKQLATHSRVALTGWDGDVVLTESPRPYFGALLRGGHVGRLAADMCWYVLSQGKLPPIGFRARLRRLLGKRPQQRRSYPSWLNETFAKRLDLRARWEQMKVKPPPGHPIRPDAYRLLTLPVWLCLFENYDSGVTRFPLEVRHPLVDLRLVDYLLSVPPVPWCVEKELLRVAMRGVLPEPVRCRPKTSLAGDPVFELLRHGNSPWAHGFDPTTELTKYIDSSAVPQVTGTEDSDELWVNVRPLSLNFWLEDLRPMNDMSGRAVV